jgi:hypothetical protein
MRNINEAIKHFEWKLANSWKPTKTDIDAYNKILEFVDQKNKEQFNDNQLFAKLYIKYSTELLRFYKTSVFAKLTHKEINRVLSDDINNLIVEYTKVANEQEIYLRMRKNGFTDKHPALKTKEEKEKEVLTKEMLEDIITFEEAENNLVKRINLTLNTYK